MERNLSLVYTTYRGHLSHRQTVLVLFARLRVCGRLLCLLKVGASSVCEGISCKLYNVKHSASLITDGNEPEK